MIKTEIMRQLYIRLLAKFPEKFNDIWYMDLDNDDSSISFTHKTYSVETIGIIDKTKTMVTKVAHTIIVIYGVGERDHFLDVNKYDDLFNSPEVVKTFDIADPTFTVEVVARSIIKLAAKTKEYDAANVLDALLLRRWGDETT